MIYVSDLKEISSSPFNFIHSLTFKISTHSSEHHPLLDPCTPVPLKPELWSTLNMNAYLDHYPLGNELNLQVKKKPLQSFFFLSYHQTSSIKILYKNNMNEIFLIFWFLIRNMLVKWVLRILLQALVNIQIRVRSVPRIQNHPFSHILWWWVFFFGDTVE